MHKSAIPPLINNDENVSSLQVSGIMIGGSPSRNWNKIYNNNQALDLTATVTVDQENLTATIDEEPIYIDYSKQPFNYIELTATEVTTRPLAINFIPTTWFYVYVNTVTDLVISPQTPYSSTFNDTNNYTLPADSLSIVHVKPSVTSVLRSRGEALDQTPITSLENEQITVSSIQLL